MTPCVSYYWLQVDAEQTYLQPAIDHVTLMAQRHFNKERATIFGTYQCYLTDSLYVHRHHQPPRRHAHVHRSMMAGHQSR